ncbi:unnamed protein product, partial [Ectocarpus sp. 12 AP-2014]
MADPHTNGRNASDIAVTNTEYNGYEPSLLSLAGGALDVTVSRGIAFTGANNQVNTLGVGLSDITETIILETTLLNVNTGTGAAQAGIWFGLDEANYVKLDVTNNNRIELRREIDDLSPSVDQIPEDNLFTAGDDVSLRMVIDPTLMTITGFYSVNGGALTPLSGSLSLPQSFLDGKEISPLEGNASFAGIFSSHRFNSSSFVASFDAFSV